MSWDPATRSAHAALLDAAREVLGSALVNAPTPDRVRLDPDPWLAAVVLERRTAADFHAAGPPGIDTGEVVHHQGGPGVALQVPIADRLGQVQPTRHDRIPVDGEPHWGHIGLAVRRSGRQPGEPLTGKVFALGLRENSHRLLLSACAHTKPVPDHVFRVSSGARLPTASYPWQERGKD